MGKFTEIWYRYGKNEGQAAYELSTAALSMGMNVALAVGEACKVTGAGNVAKMLDEGKIREIEEISTAYRKKQAKL